MAPPAASRLLLAVAGGAGEKRGETRREDGTRGGKEREQGSPERMGSERWLVAWREG